MTSDLLPCPFCNNEPAVRYMSGRYYVVCQTISCWLYEVMAHKNEWNTRTPKPVQEIEGLEEAILWASVQGVGPDGHIRTIYEAARAYAALLKGETG